MSKSAANTQAQAAFLAGQQQALSQISDPRRVNIRILGPVRFPEIAWTSGLTLAQVIADAEYLGQTAPRYVMVIRARERVPFDPEALLRGEDLPLEPGDTVEIRP